MNLDRFKSSWSRAHPAPRDAGCISSSATPTVDGVFSSTCLPEIPAQLTFAREAIRVTAETGWTVFDSIWDMTAAQRVNESRHYRFCQNHFTQLEDYLDFFTECAGPDRRIALDVPGLPARYLDAPRWITERSAMLEAVRARTDKFISVLVTRPSSFGGFRHAAHQWLSSETLAVSPAFDLASVDARAQAHAQARLLQTRVRLRPEELRRDIPRR